MKAFSSITTLVLCVVIAVSCSLFLPVFSYGASATDGSILMDLNLFIRERERLVDNTSKGIVLIVVYDDTGEESGRGSGFFIDHEGRIITTASILKNAYSAEIFSESHTYKNVVILKYNSESDLALLQVDAKDEVPLDFDYLYEIRPGRKVIIIGRASESAKTFSEGVIRTVKDIGGTSEVMEIQTYVSILSFSQSKDGPLLNESGEVIGITNIDIPDSLNDDGIPRMPDFNRIKAIRINAIKPLLIMPDNAKHLYPAKARIWSRWVIKSLKTIGITVFITLYTMGFPKVMAIVFIIILIISFIQWLMIKLKKRLFTR